MFIRIALIGLISVVIGNAARAADWFKLGETDFVARQSVLVENPGNVDDPAVSVHLKLLDLGEAMPAATKDTVAVADEMHAIVPFQVSGDQLIFVTPVKAHETKKFYVYAAKDPVQVPKFPAMTGTDSREAWRSFENEFTAFRVEVGDKAKTTGLAIDIFGKTAEGRGAQLKNIYASDYHKRQPWGIDVMKVGHGPGLGGVYLRTPDGTIGRTKAETTDFKVLYEGPVETSVQVSGPVEIGEKKFQVYRVIDMRAGERTLIDMVVVDGDPKDLKDLKIGIGLRNLPNEQVTSNADAGYATVVGDGNQEGTEKLGLGVAFDAQEYVAPPTAMADPKDGGVVYFLTPHSDNGDAKGDEKSVHVHDRLAAYWDGDGWIHSSQEFETLMAQAAQLLKSSPKVTLTKEAEKHP